MASVRLFPDSNAAMKFINHERVTTARVTHTNIVFYKLLHVLPPVEHPQLVGNVRSPVELLDEGVNGLPHLVVTRL